MSEYRWLKYRTKHAASVGDWRYREVSMSANPQMTPELQLQDCLEGLDDEFNTHGEGWRGVEGEFVTRLPRPLLEARYNGIKREAEELLAKERRYLDQLNATAFDAPYAWVWDVPWTEVDISHPNVRKAKDEIYWKDRKEVWSWVGKDPVVQQLTLYKIHSNRYVLILTDGFQPYWGKAWEVEA